MLEKKKRRAELSKKEKKPLNKPNASEDLIRAVDGAHHVVVAFVERSRERQVQRLWCCNQSNQNETKSHTCCMCDGSQCVGPVAGIGGGHVGDDPHAFHHGHAPGTCERERKYINHRNTILLQCIQVPGDVWVRVAVLK